MKEAGLDNFAGNERRDRLFAVAESLQSRIEEFASIDSTGVVVSVAQFSSDISIGDICVWDSEAFGDDALNERDCWNNYLAELKLMLPDAAGKELDQFLLQ